MAVADYLELDRFRDEIKGVSDSTHDTEYTLAIAAASRIWDRLTKYPDGAFVSQTLTRYFDVPTGSEAEFEIPGLPLLSSSPTIETDEDGDRTFETTWATTDYYLYPLSGPPYYEIQVDRTNGDYRFTAGQYRLKVTGSWGVATTVPADVERAVILIANRLLARDKSPEGILGDASRGFVDIKQIDPDVLTILRAGGWVNPRSVFA